jgi:hypothetical protein
MAIMDTLIHYSGGIDSVNVAWNYLRKNPHKILLIHHIRLKNREGRHLTEAAAVANTLKWFQDNGYSNFKYIETTYEQPDECFIPLDVYLYIGYMTPMIFRSYRGLKYLLRPAVKDDYPEGTTYPLPREIDAEKICAILLNKMPISLMPNLNKTKKEEIAELPIELFNLSWWCRRPIQEQNCHKCKTCKVVDLALQELEIDNPHG